MISAPSQKTSTRVLTNFKVWPGWDLRSVLFLAAALTSAPSSSAQPTTVASAPVPISMRLPGEFEPVSTVVISEDTLLVSDHGIPLLKELLAAKAQIIILVNENVPTATSILQYGLPELSLAEKKNIRFLHLRHGVMWIRDFGPLAGVRIDNPVEPAFADMKFDSPYQDVRTFAGRFGKRMKAPVRNSEWPLDGGNILSDGLNCYVGALEAKPGQPTREASINHRRSAWGKEIGCETVRTVYDSPHEHIDMFVKILSPRHALVGEIPQASYQSRPERVLAEKLDSVAEQMKNYVNVTRIPMPEPTQDIFRTYTNSILVNGHAIVPRYDLENKIMQKALENQAARAYEAQGFAVRFIDADRLIESGGAWHCVTLQLFGRALWK